MLGWDEEQGAAAAEGVLRLLSATTSGCSVASGLRVSSLKRELIGHREPLAGAELGMPGQRQACSDGDVIPDAADGVVLTECLCILM